MPLDLTKEVGDAVRASFMGGAFFLCPADVRSVTDVFQLLLPQPSDLGE